MKHTTNIKEHLDNSGINYGIEVTTSDTISTIISKILAWQYGLIVDSANVDGVSVDFYYSGGVTLTFTDTDSTGMTVSITDTSTAQVFRGFYFIGQNVSDWNTRAKWIDQPTLWSAYKGMFAYLAAQMPNMKVSFMIPTRFSITKADFATFTEWQASEAYIKYHNLVAFQKAACEYAGVDYVDLTVFEEHIFDNFASYYENNNVHPLDLCYQLWGCEEFKGLKN